MPVDGARTAAVKRRTPPAHGGGATLATLALGCQGCNNHTYAKGEALDAVSGEIVPLYNPCHHQWEEHFTWSDGFTLIVGLTPSGRARVDLLLLNRQGVVNLRRLLYPHGEHPAQAPEASRG